LNFSGKMQGNPLIREQGGRFCVAQERQPFDGDSVGPEIKPA
jgi:hypothetical protein